MQLGFVSAILPELSLEEVLSTAATIGYDCVEVMCWPVGKAERKYAGVTHVDVTDFSKAHAEDVLARHAKAGVDVDALAKQLQEDGAKAFVKSWNALLARLAEKTAAAGKAS